MKCSFRVISDDDGVIKLRDCDGFVSVTNEAEKVLSWCKKTYPNFKRLIYQDSRGEWTEVLDKPSSTWMGKSSITFAEVKDV